MPENLNDPPLPPLRPADFELQEALAALAAPSSGISRDELLFQAGRASVPQREVRYWKIATSMLIVVALAALYFRPMQFVDRPVDRIVYVRETKIEYATPMPIVVHDEKPETPIPQLTFDDLPADCYLRLRHDVLTEGVTAIPVNHTNAPQKPSDTSQPLWRLRQQDMGGAF